ncbi:MAG: NAD(P)H-hydrate dehydratase [Eubacteriales bacterium]
MRCCVTQKQMQDIEYDTIMNTGIPSIVLMERAALAVADAVLNNVEKKSIIHIVCGKGNNGADGIAVARLLFQQQYEVVIVTIGDSKKATEKYIIQEGIAQNLGIPFVAWDVWDGAKCDCIIDGLFGIGLTRDILGEYKSLIEKIQGYAGKQIIAIDIPSGISADTGAILGCAVKASITVTFEYGKLGHYVGAGREYAGDVIIASIGFNKKSIERIGYEARMIEEKDLEHIPERVEHANKGTYGRILVIAGSKGMSGAAYLCAKAAYKSGAGLVKILTVKENLQILQTQLPEAIIEIYKKDNIQETIEKECDWATAIVMGPGLGQEPYVKTLVQQVLKMCKNRALDQEVNTIPLVLDSDAMNTIAENSELELYYGEHIMITPHMKEMSRLTHLSVDELKKSCVQVAKEYSEKHKIVCLLKDSTSVISSSETGIYLNISGNSALAKAGTGDVLAGIVVGLLGIGMSPWESAAFASYIHGVAGVSASKIHGKHGVLASDLFDTLEVR